LPAIRSLCPFFSSNAAPEFFGTTSLFKTAIAVSSKYTPAKQDDLFNIEWKLSNEQKPGYFRETASDQVMEKVDESGGAIGFSVLKVSSLKSTPLSVELAS